MCWLTRRVMMWLLLIFSWNIAQAPHQNINFANLATFAASTSTHLHPHVWFSVHKFPSLCLSLYTQHTQRRQSERVKCEERCKHKQATNVCTHSLYSLMRLSPFTQFAIIYGVAFEEEPRSSTEWCNWTNETNNFIANCSEIHARNHLFI